MEVDRAGEGLLGRHGRALVCPPRAVAIPEAIGHREAFVSASGALATSTPLRVPRPQDTYLADRPSIHNDVD